MNTSTDEGFQLKRSRLAINELALNTGNLNKILLTLEKKADVALDFLSQSPVVINLQHVPQDEPIDFSELLKLLKSYQLFPFGYRNANKQQAEQAEQSGLIAIKEQLAAKNASAETTTEPKPTMPYASVPAKIYQGTVRSGQQILAHGDLVIIGSVSETAEVLAAGNIHIYGTLRGRALAGISGNKNSLIYCQKMAAEMLSIAGIYQMSEDMPKDISDKALLVQLHHDKIDFTCLK